MKEYKDATSHLKKSLIEHNLILGIDYALAVTGQEQLYYSGHSMGTTQVQL